MDLGMDDHYLFVSIPKLNILLFKQS